MAKIIAIIASFFSTLLLLMVISANLLATVSPSLVKSDQTYKKEIPNPEKIVLKVNEERQKNSLPPLANNNLLNLAAQNISEDMVRNKYFDTKSPSGKKAWEFIKETSYNYQYAGVSLAISNESSDIVVSRWMGNDVNRNSILDSNYQDVGISVTKDGDKYKVVILFAKPR